VNAIEAQIENFGREVRRRRQALGITLETLAQMSGLTPNYIGSVELGKRDPSLSTIEGLASGLQMPVGELLGGTRELTPAGLEAALLYDATSPEIQAAVTSILRATSRKRRGG
jgi:transcriptional regulator with XRE-family HTH domain